MDLNSKVEMIVKARDRDIGNLTVRRILPYATRRMVGPFIFFDHMGPAEFTPGMGLDVRPHPHINLSTVTYLFEGKIQHRDSMGSNQMIEPGDINWMTAGYGIVHSERTPQKERQDGSKINGIQLWVALPQDHEEMAPGFSHHPKDTIPQFETEGAHIRLLLGKAFGYQSPVPVLSDLFYAEVRIRKGNRFNWPVQNDELALYVVEGEITLEGLKVKSTEMAIAKDGEGVSLVADSDVLIMVIGGKPVGERFIYWNFVSSSKERLEEAKRLWAQGPHSDNSRFSPISDDNNEFIPLPHEPGLPKGTIM